MTTGTWNIEWGQVLATAVLTFGGSVAYYHYTAQTADLVYEIFPPAHFTSQATEVSIYNVRVENVGNKEASNVQVYLALPSHTKVQELKVEPSFASISYKIVKSDPGNSIQVHFPLLNSGEGSRFSLLVNKGEDAQLIVELRGTGVVGRSKQAGDKGTISWFNAIAKPIALAIAISAFLLMFLSKLAQLQAFLQGSFSEQLRALRTQRSAERTSALGQKELEQLLQSRPFRLFYNPKVPGLTKSKIVRFGAKGAILDGKNQNESSWRVQNTFLELMNSEGGVHSRFYYSPTDQRFYSTNDPETGCITKHGIRDQYLMPDELVTRP